MMPEKLEINAYGNIFADDHYLGGLSLDKEFAEEIFRRYNLHAQLVEALKEGLSAHWNLYKSNFGEKTNPEDDCVYRQMKEEIGRAHV